MSTLIDGINYTLGNPIATAGEGSIYHIASQLAAKIYHQTIVNRERRLKVLAFCNAYTNHIDQLGNDNYGFPSQPAYEEREELDLLSGFSMRFFEDCPSLEDTGYDLLKTNDFKVFNTFNFDDNSAVQFVYDLFDIVNRLHRIRIILGDVNSSNFLYNKVLKRPIIIDIDSAQFGQFPCSAWTDDYLDPLIQQQGKSLRGGYSYNNESDNFSLACVCFEFLVGVNPFTVYTSPQEDTIYNKEKGISHLHYIHTNVTIINGIQYQLNPLNEKIKSRIISIKKNNPKLYDFFISIFVDNKRFNLMQTLPRDNPRHPAYIFYSQSGFGDIIKVLLEKRASIQPQQASTTVTGTFKIPNSRISKVISSPSNTPSSVGKASIAQVNMSPQSQQASTLVPGTFKIPDSGISKVIPCSNVSSSSSSISPIAQINTSDPDQLFLFLENYGLDLTKIIGENS